MKPDQNKAQGFMGLRGKTTTIEARALTGMVQYYKGMLSRRSHVVSPLTEAASYPKGRK